MTNLESRTLHLYIADVYNSSKPCSILFVIRLPLTEVVEYKTAGRFLSTQPCGWTFYTIWTKRHKLQSLLKSTTWLLINIGESSMAVERTLSIIKPDAVAKNVIGQIYTRFENAGLKVIAARMVQMSRTEAENFYAVHRERPFFKDLVDFMISGPVMVQALEGENAIVKNRDLMGATDPKKADKGSIRADFADSIDANAVHGSDSAEAAAVEIAYFFPDLKVS